jgi:hypothetical protein
MNSQGSIYRKLHYKLSCGYRVQSNTNTKGLGHCDTTHNRNEKTCIDIAKGYEEIFFVLFIASSYYFRKIQCLKA